MEIIIAIIVIAVIVWLFQAIFQVVGGLLLVMFLFLKGLIELNYFNTILISNIIFHGLGNLNDFNGYFYRLVNNLPIGNDNIGNVLNTIFVENMNIVLICDVILSLYIVVVNVVSLIYIIKNCITNTKKYYKNRNDEILKSYAEADFSKLYEDIANKKYFLKFKNICSDLFSICEINWSEDIKPKILPDVLFIVLLILFLFPTLLYIFILPKALKLVVSGVIFLIEDCVMFLVCIFYRISLLLLKAYNKISKSINKMNYRCIYCEKQFNNPIYECSCGRTHLDITPNEFGLLKRTCTCGKKINTFGYNKDIVFVCPACKSKFNNIYYPNESFSLSNEPYKYSTVLLMTDETKNSFQFDFEKKLIECISKVDVFDVNADEVDFMKGYVEYQHRFKVNSPISLTVSSCKLRCKRNVQIYRYSKNNDAMYNYYKYLDSVILVVDAQSVLNNDIINYNNVISNFLVQLNMVSNAKNKIKLFVLIRDNDSLLDINADSLSKNEVHSKVEDVLIKNDCLSLLNILKTNFKNYFLCYYNNDINKSLIFDMIFCNDNKIKKIIKH